MTHDLKTWPGPFQAVWDGTLTHQIRRKDRAFCAGDYLVLLEWDPRRDVNDRYTGRALRCFVTYVSEPETFGLPGDICVMSIAGVTHMAAG